MSFADSAPAVVGSSSAAHGSWLPDPHRVVDRRQETSDVVTLSLEPLDRAPIEFRAGQFNMLSAFGIGEVAISISSAPAAPGPIEHTVREVGAVTRALCKAPKGSVVGVRGAFGTDWGLGTLADRDVVVVAGGIGLAPLRGAVHALVDSLEGTSEGPGAGTRGRDDRRITVLVGARSPDQVVFSDDIGSWRRRGAEVEVSVDVADTSWPGAVGVVTTLLATREFDPTRTSALVCGPEVMMRFTARALVDKGLRPESIRLSLERNMQCGIGLCGHCQLGPLLICRDGPVVTYTDALRQLLSVHEL